MVYEASNEEERRLLVDSLMDAFMMGKKPQAKVTPDTKVFKDGVLGTAPGGYVVGYRVFKNVLILMGISFLIYLCAEGSLPPTRNCVRWRQT
jgi:hypothetical protein